MNDIIGHKSILDFFEKVQKAGNLGHAYCFVGQSGLGKRTVAQHLATTLLAIEQEQLPVHPDFFSVAQEINEKTGKTKKNIDVEQIRKLRSALMQKPFLGKHKIAIIDEAEKMNANAANALLKTLEEPKEHTVLFLVTSDVDRLPATIQSRCQMICFHPAAQQDIQQALSKRSIGEQDAQRMAQYALGRPGVALQWATDQDLFESYSAEVVRFQSLLGKPFYEKIALVEELFGDKTDHIAAREKLKTVLSGWNVFVRDSLLSSLQMNNFQTHEASAEQWNATVALSVNEKIDSAIELLDHNIHPRLLVEHILLAIP